MSTVRITIRWLIVLLITGSSLAAAYAYHLWREQDRLLTQTVMNQLAEKLPHWNVSLSRVRFDWNRRIHLHDLMIVDNAEQIIARVPEVVLVVDTERLTGNQQIVVQEVEFRAPELHLVRNASGRWNIDELLPLPVTDASLPDWQVNGGSVFLHVSLAGRQPGSLRLSELNADFEATGKKKFTFEGQTKLLDNTGLDFFGDCDLLAREWSIGGHFPDLNLNQTLIEQLARLHPEILNRLYRIDEGMVSYFQRSTGGSAGGDVAQHGANDRGMPQLGLTGKSEINFRWSHWGPETPPDYRVLVKLSQTQLSHRTLPIPIHDLNAKLYLDRRQMLVRELSARNGITEVSGEATVSFSAEGPKTSVNLAARGVVLDDRLYRLIPVTWQRLYDLIQPAGQVDVDCSLERKASGRWRVSDAVLIPRNCAASHVKFPYPIREITGLVKQSGPGLDFEYQLTGVAGGRPVRLKGLTRNAGPEAETSVSVDVLDLPVDSTFRAACAAPVRRTLESMKLEGQADINARFYRPPGRGQRFLFELDAELTDAALQCEFFPLRIDQMAARISFSSRTGLWSFNDLTARHGDAIVNGRGEYSALPGPDQLSLSLSVRQALLDKSLELAMPDALQAVWDQLSPSGQFHSLVEIRWTPGQPVQIALPLIKIYDGGLTLKGFPVPLKDVAAELSYASGRMEIRSIRARHDQTMIRARGFASHGSGLWRVRLEQLFVDDLVPDRVFRLALPVSLRLGVEQLNPRGELSLSGMLDLRGTEPPDDVVTAAWDLEMVCSGNTLDTGLELSGVRGRVTATGQYDGVSLHNEGRIELDSVTVLEHQLSDVRGPYTIHDDQLIVGAKEIVSPVPKPVPSERRLVATAIAGEVTLDAIAILGDSPSFRLIAGINNGSMQEYARLYLPGENNLRGVVNGWVDLHGRADGPGNPQDSVVGRGQLKISPAALYELPVIVQIFKVMSFVPPDRTAFNYALVDFEVNRGSFWFQSIDLVGDAISLRGKGSARFDGRLDLDFYSMLGRNANPRLPVFDVLINTATTGWVGVEVDGSISSPRARLKVAPTIDDTLRRFLGTFNGGLKPPVPVVAPPRVPVRQGRTADGAAQR